MSVITNEFDDDDDNKVGENRNVVQQLPVVVPPNSNSNTAIQVPPPCVIQVPPPIIITTTTADNNDVVLSVDTATTGTAFTIPLSSSDDDDKNENNSNSTCSSNTPVLVSTKYGNGHVVQYRSEDQIYTIQLHNFGSNKNTMLLYAPSEAVVEIPSPTTTVDSSSNEPISSEMDVSMQSGTSASTTNNIDDHNDQSIMELNVAYESLETMRKLNLEMTCQEQQIPYTPQDLQTTCAVCLLSREPMVVATISTKPTSASASSSTTTKLDNDDSTATSASSSSSSSQQQQPKRSFSSRFLTRSTSSSSSSTKVSTATFIQKKYGKAKVSAPCLICGTPICIKHASPSFRKEQITMCCTCEALFGLSYVTQLLTCSSPQQRRQYIDTMIELYDRTILLLRFMTTMHFDDVCTTLQQSTIRKNKVGIGSSSAGIVSGVLGIVSAVTIFTPIGPPLLIASLVFGGSATAAQTTAQIRHSSMCSEPHRIADRIIALHGICWNILRVTGTLRDALLLDHLRTDLYTVDDNGHGVQHIMLTGTSQISSSPISEYYRTHQNEVLAKASNLGSIGAVGAVGFTAVTMEVGAVTAVGVAETGVVAARGATFFSRSGTAASAAMNALQFARFAGGTLSAATIVFEAHNLKNTIRAIQSGNPCEKAETIKRIRDQIRDIPSTHAVDGECERYLQALTRRQRVLTEQEVTDLLLENNEILQEAQELATSERQQESNHTGNNDHCDDDDNNNNDDDPNAHEELDTSDRSKKSIRQRIARFHTSLSQQEEEQDSTIGTTTTATTSRPLLSLRERIQLHKRKEHRSTSPSASIRECNNEYGEDAEHAENLIC